MQIPLKPSPGHKIVQLDDKTFVEVREDQDEQELRQKFANRKLDWNIGYVDHYGSSYKPRFRPRRDY